jgi:hypothetical protein
MEEINEEQLEEVPLAGGWTAAEVVRIGAMVHRTMGERAPFVHRLLGYLEEIGFAGVPRYRGIDRVGREMLTYIEGEVGFGREPGAWTDEQLVVAARLLRRFHDATAGSELAGDEEVVCHNDCAPWNTVFVDEAPVALIDFDDAAPGPRIRDLAYAVWCWLGVGGVGDDGWNIAELASKMRLMCLAYGFDDRGQIVPEILNWQVRMQAQHERNGLIEQAGRVAEGRDRLQRHARHLRRILDGTPGRGGAKLGTG